MGGKTSAKCKNENTRKNYNRLSVLVPKGKKDYYYEEAKKAGMSFSAYAVYCMDKDIAERENDRK